jgi:3-methyladenine DNA glycosylase/8-oxoguanine DNA glycosylase
MTYDPQAAVRALGVADPTMAELITRVGACGLEIRSQATPFEALLRSIIYQQLSGRAAATIHARVTALIEGRDRLQPRQVLALPEAALRQAGLSRNKAAAIRDLAEKAAEGIVPSRCALADLDDEAIIARLIAVRGVGRWTVEMLLIFYLGRPDILPLDDLGIKKGFKAAYRMKKLPHVRTLTRAGKRWTPYRSVASWYLWRAAETVF